MEDQEKPKGWQHYAKDTFFKVGANGMVYRYGLNGWVSSTMTIQEVKKAEESDKRHQERIERNNAVRRKGQPHELDFVAQGGC